MKTIIELEFTDASWDALKNLMIKSNAGSRAETIRQALACFDWFLSQKAEGNSVIIGEPEDKAFYEMELEF